MEAAWVPPPELVARAQVTRLARELGCADFPAMYRVSVERPDAYWRHLIGFLRIAWSRPPAGYVDLPEGPPFPNWFPGGELNWVDTVLGWGRDYGDVPPLRGVVIGPPAVQMLTVSVDVARLE